MTDLDRMGGSPLRTDPVEESLELRKELGSPIASADRVIALFLIGASLYVLYETRLYPESIVQGAPGPALFPRVLAVGLLLLSLIMLVKGGTRIGGERFLEGAALKRIGTVILLIVGFLALAGRADFFVLIFLLLGAVNFVAGEKRIHVNLLLPALFVAFVYFVFYRLFGVMFPTNLF